MVSVEWPLSAESRRFTDMACRISLLRIGSPEFQEKKDSELCGLDSELGSL